MMTPREGSNLCIKMAGYGIKESVVKAIQDDARKDLLKEILRLKPLEQVCRKRGLTYITTSVILPIE